MTGFERLLAGHLLCDRYRVETVIGRGGMGAVYSATDLRLERAVALKVVTVPAPDAAARARVRARFHREARAAARLQHANVVTVYDFGTDPRLDLDFLVMELLRGEDLATRLARSLPPLDLAVEVLRQAAEGLAAGHRAGLVHRDVKPGNLFLASDPRAEGLRVCVLDFGIVQLAAEEEATMTHLTLAGRGPHSPAYAAPEQLRGGSDLSPACDVFGLGVTAFQLLTGARPFSEVEQQRMAAGTPLPAPSVQALNPAIPTLLDRVVRTALAHRPTDRYRDAGEMAAALAAALGQAPRPAPPPPVREDDRTLLDPAPRPVTRGGTVFAPGPAPAFGAPLPPVRPERTAPVRTRAAGLVRRTLGALWELTLTAAGGGVGGALWLGMAEAQHRGLREPFYAALIGLTVVTPWVTKRLFGRGSSYVLGLAFSIASAVAVLRFFEPLSGPERALVALPAAQILTTTWIARITRRKPKPEVEALLSSLPE